MSMASYNLLKRTLRFDVAADWVPKDSADDFFPDPLAFREIVESNGKFLARREHRMLQVDSLPVVNANAVKHNGMLREALWLHPTHRVVYLAIVRHFAHRLDAHLLKEVYSYRHDSPDDPNRYPFANRIDRWKNFENDFRAAIVDENVGAVVITDLASYFDHISCKRLCHCIRSMLGDSFTDADSAVLELFEKLLNLWCTHGHGIPQNYDASSFFGSLYLHPVDVELRQEGIRFFRWLDDIRLVASDHGAAVKALHSLQLALARHRLFLASDKTEILRRGDKRLSAIVDVSDDVLISEIEEKIATAKKEKIRAAADQAFARLEFHADSKDGDDRKFRAFGNRLLDAGDFEELKHEIYPKFAEFVAPRISAYPSRTDYWVKFLSACGQQQGWDVVHLHLVDKPSLFAWQRFYLWDLAINLDGPPRDSVMKTAQDILNSNEEDLVTSKVMKFIGRHGDNIQRSMLFQRHFSSQAIYPIQRAILIAIQELPPGQRDEFYDYAQAQNAEHKDLIEFLTSRDAPIYGIRQRPTRNCADQGRSLEIRVRRGIGLRDGEVVQFRLSRKDYDYE
jgi:hypothetical protein